MSIELDIPKSPPGEQTLIGELASSAMLFALALGSTAGVVGLAQLAVRVLA
ncbi:MAG TPA: hypothetical protein VNA14_06905 [Mycobacteriales bacterium]|nr:hypothetical protein [Mycobacteriales bacterium]